MPEYATGISGGRRPNRRPIIDHAGEVTKKKALGAAENQPDEEAPPTFTGRKIGGLRRLNGNGGATIDDNGSQDSSQLSGLGGISFQGAGSKAIANDLDDGYLLAAPPGWKMFWGLVTRGEQSEWDGLPDIRLRDVCKACYEEEELCGVTSFREKSAHGSRATWVCNPCSIRNSGHCLRLIAFKAHPMEKLGLDRIPEFNIRHLTRRWHEAVEDGRSLPTASQFRQLRPPWMASSSLTSNYQRLQAAKPTLDFQSDETQNAKHQSYWVYGEFRLPSRNDFPQEMLDGLVPDLPVREPLPCGPSCRCHESIADGSQSLEDLDHQSDAASRTSDDSPTMGDEEWNTLVTEGPLVTGGSTMGFAAVSQADDNDGSSGDREHSPQMQSL